MENFNHSGAGISEGIGPRYADLTKDSGFKAVFADKEDHTALLTLLNTFLPPDRQVIQISHLGDREQDPETKGSGTTHLDLHCVDSLGRDFIVEMQRGSYSGMVNRFFTYISKTFSGNFKAYDLDPKTGLNKTLRERYTQMPPAYLVAFLLKEMKEEGLNRTESLVSHIVPRDIYTDIDVPAVINLILVRLNKTKSSVSERDSDWDKCCFTLKNSALFSQCPPEVEGSRYASFVEKAEIANFGEIKAKLYQDTKMREELEQLNFEEGVSESREEGRVVGLAEGRAEGLAEGRAVANLEVAKRMLVKGLDLVTISEVTGLGEEQLTKLLKEAPEL